MLKPQALLNQHASNPFTGNNTLFPWHTTFASNSLIDRKRENRKVDKKAHRVQCCARGESSKLNAVASPSVPAPLAAGDSGKSMKLTATVIVQISDEGMLDYIDNVMGRKIIVQLVPAENNSQYSKPVEGKAYKKGMEDENDIEYKCELDVPEGFGEIGGVLIESKHTKEIYVRRIYLDGFEDGRINVSCKSFVQPSTKKETIKRIFFTNKSYLPSQTPSGLRDYRERDLSALRGDGTGERKYGERIYDYDVYNDLGDPDKYEDPEKGKDLKREVLGGSTEFPYPRRGRTGRPRCKNDKNSETLPEGNFYVPRDEYFSEVKMENHTDTTNKGIKQSFVPGLENAFIGLELGFPYFTAIDQLFNEDEDLSEAFQEKLKNIFRRIVTFLPFSVKKVLRFGTPAVLDRDKFLWIKDEEFGRQTLAGINPCSIKLVKDWPLKSNLDPAIYGPPESAITTKLVEMMMLGRSTVEEAIKDKKLFVVDYHDLLLPYVHKVRDIEGVNLYGARALFFRTHLNTLKPIAIELVRPKGRGRDQWKEVYLPGLDSTSGWLWKLAKAQFLAIDSGYHQLISHWIRTHCAVEPYVLATNRQLSALHPIYRLLKPHLRYTMNINALARQGLINANGIIESSFSPGRYSMEISSVAYKLLWRFDEEGLPADLIKRGMAEEDPNSSTGVKLVIEDYPYASDGLILWTIIKEWVKAYVDHYYPDASHVESDDEINNWWTEIRTVGHGDKKEGWPKLENQDDLTEILVTIIWVASGHHAAVNFGQYDFAAYFPNRPTISRTKMPNEDKTDEAWESFLSRPEDEILACYPTPTQAVTVMTTLSALSNHSPDEEYIGQEPEPSWAEDEVINRAFELFQNRLLELDGIIDARNSNPKLKNRTGAGVVPYEFYKPKSGPGITSKGVPNSVSI
ncbi:linoleate 13S-lipoxygenase 2-1, chloroplastic-like [Apium graveolens]|uniref:linoleate 13S-lipoxygenase 2-1, chloroplastic-like n=1 Tax=Apium graveolens TaxID=4045 RepID=UPI003D7AE7A2